MSERAQAERFGALRVVIHADAAALACAAASEAATAIRRELDARGHAAIILAAASSQTEFLARLAEAKLPWGNVSILHMDEYVGIDERHPASFRRYLREQVVSRVHPAAFHPLAGDAPDLTRELDRYRRLLEREQPCLCVLGIGENGHLAFNDPPADLDSDEVIHEVTLDLACRRQQVGEGHFPELAAVPPRALTLTVRALLETPTVIGVVPELRKAQAVHDALEGPLSPDCPASALRRATGAVLHLDRSSASLLHMV